MRKEEDKRTDKYELTIQKVLKHNTPEKNVLKVVEECMELSEVLVKYLTKQPEDKPKIDKIIEESGDVIARLRILCYQLDITREVSQRIDFKFKQLDEWMRIKYEGVV